MEKGQTRAIAACVALLHSHSFITPTAKVSFSDLLKRLDELLNEKVIRNMYLVVFFGGRGGHTYFVSVRDD